MPLRAFGIAVGSSYSVGASRGSPRLHSWLLADPRLGPLIQEWQLHGAIARPIKLLALVTMALSLAVTTALGFAHWILASQALVLAAVALSIVTRPGRPHP